MTKNTPERAAMLADRRRFQLSMQPGFTPMPSKRVDGAIMSNFLSLMQMWNFSRPEHEVREEAVRNVMRTLPPARGSRYRVRPSKSDSPAYRNPALLAARP